MSNHSSSTGLACSPALIPVVEAKEFTSPADFYSKYHNHPVIVRGLLAENTELNTTTSENAMQKLFPDSSQQSQKALGAINSNSHAYEEISPLEFFEEFNKKSSKYNIIDCSLSEEMTSAKKLFGPAPFMFADNWLLEDFAFEGAKTYERVLVLSSIGAYTPLHYDFKGTQGWMYLAFGKKYWEFYDPKYIPLLFDMHRKEFYNEKRAEKDEEYAKRFPLAHLALPHKKCGTLHGGELMFIPPGWLHQVATLEQSFGMGGGVLNAGCIKGSVTMRSWEIATYGAVKPGGFIIEDFIQQVLKKRNGSQKGQSLSEKEVKDMQEAMEYCRELKSYKRLGYYTSNEFQ